jgi:hypothetical protein
MNLDERTTSFDLHALQDQDEQVYSNLAAAQAFAAPTVKLGNISTN